MPAVVTQKKRGLILRNSLEIKEFRKLINEGLDALVGRWKRRILA